MGDRQSAQPKSKKRPHNLSLGRQHDSFPTLLFPRRRAPKHAGKAFLLRALMSKQQQAASKQPQQASPMQGVGKRKGVVHSCGSRPKANQRKTLYSFFSFPGVGPVSVPRLYINASVGSDSVAFSAGRTAAKSWCV